MYKVIYWQEAEDNTWATTSFTASTLTDCCDQIVALANGDFKTFEDLAPNYYKQVDGDYVKVSDPADFTVINNKHSTI